MVAGLNFCGTSQVESASLKFDDKLLSRVNSYDPCLNNVVSFVVV